LKLYQQRHPQLSPALLVHYLATMAANNQAASTPTDVLMRERTHCCKIGNKTFDISIEVSQVLVCNFVKSTHKK
jgi:hypothetical protein